VKFKICFVECKQQIVASYLCIIEQATPSSAKLNPRQEEQKGNYLFRNTTI